MDKPIDIPGPDKNLLHLALDKAPRSPNLAQLGEGPGLARVFVANFDGTWNDLENLAKDELPTLVAASSANVIPSNVVDSHYYKGVGTGAGPVNAILEGATGYGCKQRAENALRDLSLSIRKWRAEAGDDIQVHVHAVGFSRGSATALHFLNLVHQKFGELMPGTRNAKWQGLACLTSSAVLLDAVATGQEDVLTLGLPPSAVSVLHIIAGREKRRLFPLTSLVDPSRRNELAQVQGINAVDGNIVDMDDLTVTYRRLHQIMLPGAHSDIGGAYRDGGLRNAVEYMIHRFQSSLGLPLRKVAERPSFASVQRMLAHESRSTVEQLMRAKPYRRGMQRSVDDVEVTQWDGSVTQMATLHGKVRGSRTISVVKRGIERIEPKSGDIIMDYQGREGQEFQLEISLRAKDGGLQLKPSVPGVFRQNTKQSAILLYGRPMQGIPSVVEIAQMLKGEVRELKLKVSIEKALPKVIIPGRGMDSEDVLDYQLAKEEDLCTEMNEQIPLPMRKAIKKIQSDRYLVTIDGAKDVYSELLRECANDVQNQKTIPVLDVPDIKFTHDGKGLVISIEPVNGIALRPRDEAQMQLQAQKWEAGFSAFFEAAKNLKMELPVKIGDAEQLKPAEWRPVRARIKRSPIFA